MKKVFVGLSGGVDSSVSAAILKEQGYDVTGVFIKVWHPDFLPCDWKTDMRDAMRVCAKLKIPFKKYDLEKEYKEGVIDYMIEEYKHGRTPNPDVMCNKEVKFKAFMDKSLADGADYIATGHYAVNKKSDSQFSLLKSKDSEKDQTYFLWNLNQKILSRVLFPIGDMEKKDVRKLAKKYELNTAEKKDSQGLCFIGMLDMKLFLKKYIDSTPGDVLDLSGKVIGKHEGSVFYTIGERHGFEIFNKKETDQRPYYVVSKNYEKNQIVVSNDLEKESDFKELDISNLNLIRNPKNLDDLEARIRYRGALHQGKLEIQGPESGIFTFKNQGEPVSKGQSIVFYQGDECLGGGIIS